MERAGAVVQGCPRGTWPWCLPPLAAPCSFGPPLSSPEREIHPSLLSRLMGAVVTRASGSPWTSGSFLPTRLLSAPDYLSPFTGETRTLPRTLPLTASLSPLHLPLSRRNEPQTFSFGETSQIFSGTRALIHIQEAKESLCPKGGLGSRGCMTSADELSLCVPPLTLRSEGCRNHVHSVRFTFCMQNVTAAFSGQRQAFWTYFSALLCKSLHVHFWHY